MMRREGSTDDSPRSHWLRLHLSTYLMLACFAGLLVLANWPMDYVEVMRLRNPGEVDGVSDPTDFVRRTPEPLRFGGVPWRYCTTIHDAKSPWPWRRERPVTFWSWKALAADLAVAVVLLVFAGAWKEWRSRRRKRFFQITLADVLLIMVIAALPPAWWRWHQNRYQRQEEIVFSEGVIGNARSLRYPKWLEGWFDERRLQFLEEVTGIACARPDGERVLSLGQLSELEALGLHGGDYAIDDLAVLHELPLLHRLAITESPAADGVMRYVRGLRSLDRLDLNGTTIQDESLAGLRGLTKLRSLNLRETGISDDALRHVGTLRGLREVELDGLDGRGLVHLHGHPGLVALTLGEMAEVDLRDMPRLNSLRLPYYLDRLHLENLPALDSIPSGNINWLYRDAVTEPYYVFRGSRSLFTSTHYVDAKHVVLSNLENLKSARVDACGLEEIQFDQVPQLWGLTFVHVQRGEREDRDSVFTLSEATFEQIGKLTSLRSLNLSGIQADDQRYAILSGLPKLQLLRLNASSIGDAGLAYFRQMHGLRVLDLRGTRISDEGWAQMPRLPHLMALTLSETSVTRLHLDNLPHLKTLDIRGTPLEDLKLVELPLLEEPLVLRKMPLRSVEFVNLPNLPEVSLANTAPLEIRLQGLTGLYALDLGHTLADDDVIRQLVDCESLMRLNLTATRVTDESMETIGRLESLESLDLEDTAITDAGAVHLARLQMLRRLNLTGTRVTDKSLQNLRGLESLELLYLGRTQVTGSGLAYLQNLQLLRKLSLGETIADTQSLTDLPLLNRLVWLRLSDTRIDDRALAFVSRLPLLEYLYVNGCNITDAGLKPLERMDHLRRLNVKATKISSEAIREFRRIRPRTSIPR